MQANQQDSGAVAKVHGREEKCGGCAKKVHTMCVPGTGVFHSGVPRESSLKSRWWIGERRRPGEKSPQGCLSGLFVTDSKGWFLLGGLYMALFPQYAEYELRNSNAYTRRFSAFGAIYRRSSVFELLKSAIDKRSSGFRRRQNRR